MVNVPRFGRGFVVDIASQPTLCFREPKGETGSRQLVAVRHSGKKSYFDRDSLPMPAMILEGARRLPHFQSNTRRMAASN